MKKLENSDHRQILPNIRIHHQKPKNFSRNGESNLLISAITAISRQLRQGYLRTPRMQEPRRELVLICNLDPHYMIHLLTHHLWPTLHPKKQVASVTWKQDLADPKNYLICTPVILSFSIQLSLRIERTVRYRRSSTQFFCSRKNRPRSNLEACPCP